jgi:hypothetical protein
MATTTTAGTTVITITAIGIAKASSVDKLRAIVGALAGLVAFAGVALALSPNAPLSTFPSEAQAQQHCPRDTVVWLNLPTSVYHYKGQRWYGNTIPGAFVCRSEADQAGDRASSQ